MESQHGIRTMFMYPGGLLIVSLLALYLSVMLIFWHGHRGHKRAKLLGIEVPFALQEGQTILGVMDTTERTCFCIGQMEEHVYNEDTIT